MLVYSDTWKERRTDVKIAVNLSSEPFRRDRPILVASGVCAVLLAGLLGLLVYLISADRARMGESRAAVDRLNREAAAMTAEQAQLDATLRQPANASVLERSLLLNTLVERKSVSWTKIFADLEEVMPANVRLIQVRLPQIDSRNEILLDMIVGAPDPEPVITFLKKLQTSPRFGPANVHNSVPPSDNEPLYRYRVSVSYAQKL
jgi:type IV pilus assembly protein PilN